MNGYFKKLIITKQGLEMLNEVLGKKGSIEFTKISLGRGKKEDSIIELKNIIDKVMDIPIKISIENSTTYKIIGLLDNKNVKDAFWLTEMGVYARIHDGEEILFSYTYAEIGEYVPPSSEVKFVREFSFDTTISQSSNVELIVDDSNIYATQEDLRYLDNKFNSVMEDTSKYLDKEITTNQTIKGSIQINKTATTIGLLTAIGGITTPSEVTSTFNGSLNLFGAINQIKNLTVNGQLSGESIKLTKGLDSATGIIQRSGYFSLYAYNTTDYGTGYVNIYYNSNSNELYFLPKTSSGTSVAGKGGVFLTNANSLSYLGWGPGNLEDSPMQIINADTATNSGVYYRQAQSGVGPWSNTATVIQTMRVNSNYIIQVAYPVASNTTSHAYRCYINGTWTTWRVNVASTRMTDEEVGSVYLELAKKDIEIETLKEKANSLETELKKINTLLTKVKGGAQ